MATNNIITKEECILLNEILGTKTPQGCFNFSRTDFEDKFTVPNSEAGSTPFDGRDKEKHRNSWLMPKMARRMTRHNKYHVANWRQEVAVDKSECDKIRAKLDKALGDEGKDHLPKACQFM